MDQEKEHFCEECGGAQEISEIIVLRDEYEVFVYPCICYLAEKQEICAS